MKFRYLILIATWLMFSVISCEKEKLDKEPATIENSAPNHTRDGELNVQDEPTTTLRLNNTGVGGRTIGWSVDDMGNYLYIEYSFSWFPHVAWGPDGGEIPDFKLEVFEIACITEVLVEPAIWESFEPINVENSYYGMHYFIPPLDGSKCYVLRITDPYGNVYTFDLFV